MTANSEINKEVFTHQQFSVVSHEAEKLRSGYACLNFNKRFEQECPSWSVKILSATYTIGSAIFNNWLPSVKSDVCAVHSVCRFNKALSG